MNTIEITVDDRAVSDLIAKAADKFRDLSPLMAGIAQDLHGGVEDTFAIEGPNWPDLAETTQRQRARKYGEGKAATPKLIQRGDLIRSIIPGHSATEAWVGTNKIYAPILHFGGEINHPARGQFTRTPKSGKNKGRRLFSNLAKSTGGVDIRAHTTTIPPRPFMVIPEETLKNILMTIQTFIDFQP
jgi:phage gpG-like protein